MAKSIAAPIHPEYLPRVFAAVRPIKRANVTSEKVTAPIKREYMADVPNDKRATAKVTPIAFFLSYKSAKK